MSQDKSIILINKIDLLIKLQLFDYLLYNRLEAQKLHQHSLKFTNSRIQKRVSNLQKRRLLTLFIVIILLLTNRITFETRERDRKNRLKQ